MLLNRMPGDLESDIYLDYSPVLVQPSLSFIAIVVCDGILVDDDQMLHMQLMVYNHGSKASGAGTLAKGGPDGPDEYTTF